MLQFPQLGLIVIVTRLEIQQEEGKWRSALLLLAGISVDETALSSQVFLMSYGAETTRKGQWGEADGCCAGGVNVFRLTDGDIPEDTSFMCILLGSGQ